MIIRQVFRLLLVDIKRFSALLTTLLVISMLSPGASARIASASISPSSLQVNISTGLNTTLNWTVTLNRSNATSTQGQFLAGIDAFQTVPLTLLVPAPMAPTPQPVIVSENLSITAQRAQSWWDSGVRVVQYRRNFSDSAGDGASTASAGVAITLVNTTPNPPNPNTPAQPQAQGLNILRGFSSAHLQLHRLELRFTDLKTIQFIDQGEPIKAQLIVSHSGAGLLRGQWQIADPATSVGDPRFRTLHVVNQQLSGSQRTELVSPQLPAQLAGRYYLRFCVTGIGNQALPSNGDLLCPSEMLSTVVGYQVFPKAAVQTMTGLLPDAGEISAQSELSWPAVPGTMVYQLQVLTADQRPAPKQRVPLFDQDNVQFVGGLLLPGDITHTQLPDSILSKLNNAHRYYWRIAAYDKRGKLVARSEPRLFSFIQQNHQAY